MRLGLARARVVGLVLGAVLVTVGISRVASGASGGYANCSGVVHHQTIDIPPFPPFVIQYITCTPVTCANPAGATCEPVKTNVSRKVTVPGQDPFTQDAYVCGCVLRDAQGNVIFTHWDYINLGSGGSAPKCDATSWRPVDEGDPFHANCDMPCVGAACVTDELPESTPEHRQWKCYCP